MGSAAEPEPVAEVVGATYVAGTVTSATLTPLAFVLARKHMGIPDAPYVGLAQPQRSFVTVADGSTLLDGGVLSGYVTGYCVARVAFVAAKLASGVPVVPGAQAVLGLGVKSIAAV